MNRPNKPPGKIYSIQWEHTRHVQKMGFSTKEEKIRSHNVRKLDVEQALFENEYPTAITGQEKSRDYQGPVYEVIGRNNGG